MINKKGGLVLVLCIFAVLTILTLTSFAIAATNSTNTTSTTSLTGFEKSYSCLKTQIDARGYADLTDEELIFSILALGYDATRQTALKTELDKRKSSTENCWPSGGCMVKETAQVMLAYTHINADVTGIKNWLLNQTVPATDLNWYLQIETNNQSHCTITYDNLSKSINLDANKQLSGNPGSCLSFAQNNYWLQISSRCYDREFEVSCDNDFLTSTFYKKTSGDIYYVTASTQTASPNGKLTSKVDSLCFKQGGVCSYEGSLWATYAINKKDSAFKNKILPYLIALSLDSANQRYIPSSFLYSITSFNEYLTTLTNLQNTKGYWQISEANKRYYDTALALMAFYGHSGSTQSDSAIQYLLDPSVQGDGCWNGGNIRDTAFILYASSPKAAASTTGASMSQCADYSNQGYSCTSSTTCDTLGGSPLPNFNCFSGLICCSKSAIEPSCSAKNGVVCSADEECSGTTDSALGTTSCCIDGQCNPKDIGPVANECADAGYTCKDSCLSDEDDKSTSFSCPADMNGVCCAPKVVAQKSYWWLWLLIILIILVVLAIIFRDQVAIWWFKIKSKFQKAPLQSQGRPSYPPQGMQPQRQMMPPVGPPRTIVPGQRQMMPRPIERPFPKEQELNETLKKLKDMSGKK
jgi:hypothetical protein